MSSLKKERTVLKTIRITQNTNQFLKVDATAKKITINSLIQSILTKYVEWDRFAQRYGFISTTHDAFDALINSLDYRKLETLATEQGELIPKDIMQFWFGQTGVNGFLSYLMLMCEYATFAKLEIKRDGPKHSVTLHHDLGEKWSIYLKYFLRAGLRATTGITGKVETSKSSAVLHFTS